MRAPIAGRPAGALRQATLAAAAVELVVRLADARVAAAVRAWRDGTPLSSFGQGWRVDVRVARPSPARMEGCHTPGDPGGGRLKSMEPPPILERQASSAGR